MAALQEGEEQKDHKRESLYLSTEHDAMECEESGNDQMPGQATSSVSAHGSTSSDRVDSLDPKEFANDQVGEDAYHDEAVPDAKEPPEDHSAVQNDTEMAEPSQQRKPMEMEMATLRSGGSSAQVGPLPASSTVEEEAEEDDHKDFDPYIGDLFEGVNDGPRETTMLASNHTGFGASCSSSRSLPLNAASAASEAYSLCESNDTPRADEARTIVIDWDTNAEQHYNLRTLEQPLLDKTAEGVEERRRKMLESCTLHDCLTHDFKPHPRALDGDNLWKCGGCKKMVNGIKSMRLWKTPDILLIGLKRFDYCEALDRLIKLKQLVEFPLEGLDLSEYYAPQLEDNPIYDLYGVCHHLGDGPKVGHYTSCVKSPGGKWHKFNDSWVTAIDAHSVVSQDAYLLYYRKRDLPCPSEREILESLKRKEQMDLEEQAVQFYESRIGCSISGVSDEETMSGSIHGRHQFGKDICNGRVENGSSSSNEMNNENEMTSLSIDNHGNGSSVHSLTGGSRTERIKVVQGTSSSSYQEPENRSDVFYATEKGEVVMTTSWAKQNDEHQVEAWNQESDPMAESAVGHSHDSERTDIPWKGDSTTGTVQMHAPFERDMYDSFQHDSRTS